MIEAKVLECRAPDDPSAFRLSARGLREPRANEVVVDVEASAVNPIDAKRATGYGRYLLGLKGAGRFPLVLGNDFAGVVRAAGQRACGLRRGERVHGVLPIGRTGAHASTVVVDARWIRRSPMGQSPEQLAVLPYTFTTMALAVRNAGLDRTNAAGKRVLINGAAGGLGQLALQLLVPWGARVTALCSGRDAALCEALGADRVVDRHRQPLQSLGVCFDATLNFGAWQDDAWMVRRLKRDALGHATTVHPLLDHFDRLGAIRGAWQARRDFLRQRAELRPGSPGAHYAWITFRPDATSLDLLDSMLAAHAVSLPIGCSVPAHEASAAFSHVQQRRPGRAVLQFRSL